MLSSSSRDNIFTMKLLAIATLLVLGASLPGAFSACKQLDSYDRWYSHTQSSRVYNCAMRFDAPG